MKNNMLDIFNREDMSSFKQDPEWFKKALLSSCSRDCDGSINHLEYSEFVEVSDNPIVTLLKYLHPIMPDSLSPYDDEVKVESSSIDGNTCIVLLRDDDGYYDPLTGIKVADSGLRGYSEKQIFKYTIGVNRELVMVSDNDTVPPFAYVNDDVLDYWEKNTIPFKEEIENHLKKIQEKTRRNFCSIPTTDEQIKLRLEEARKRVNK